MIIQVFLSYTSADESLKQQLATHLTTLEREGAIATWEENRISAGSDRLSTINRQLAEADIILLLISADYIASDYHYNGELQQAIQRHASGRVRVVPILLRPVDWQNTILGQLQSLPRNAKPVTSWKNKDEAFLDVVMGLRQTVETFANPRTQSQPWKPFKDIQRDKSQQILLDFIEQEVNGRLRDSLHNRVSIILDKADDPSKIRRPWEVDVKIGTHKPQPLPSQTPIIEVYDSEEINNRLLILGAPGSGKTTTLLEIAQVLVNRAQADKNCPFPVLLNLSSWKDDKQSIKDWMADVLFLKYGVRKDVGQKWIEEQAIIPLLDGLDELETTRQRLCVEKINQFLQPGSWLNPVIVCSRLAEFELLDTPIGLNGAIILQPLTNKQIRDYILQTQDTQLWASICSNSELMDLAKTPLLLNVMLIACEEISFSQWQQMESTEERLDYLFDSYIKRMLKRPYQGNYKPTANTIQWLEWLAVQLTTYKQTEFFIENLQPYWLKKRWEKLLYGLIFGLIRGLIWGLILRLITQLIVGLIFGLIFGLLKGRGEGLSQNNIQLIATLKFKSKNRPIRWLIFSPIFGLIYGLIGWLIYEIISNLTFWLIVWLIVWLIYRQIRELIRWLSGEEIQLIASLKLSFIFNKSYLIEGLISGLIFGGIYGQTYALTFWIIFGVIEGLIYGLIGGLYGNDIDIKVAPNQGIKSSSKNAIILSFTGILIITLIIFFLQSIVKNFQLIDLQYLLPVLAGSLMALLIFYSFLPVIQHFILRVILWFRGYAPWNYVRFLNYATNRLFLQRVGGGYRFIHRLLQEHFAKKWQAEDRK